MHKDNTACLLLQPCLLQPCCREAPTDGPGFSITGRPTNTPAGSAPSDTPGPGHYNTASTAGAAAGTAASPAWTIAGRVNDAAAAAAAAKAQWPGPGDYDVTPQGPDGPAYSIQGKAKAAGGWLARRNFRAGHVCWNAVREVVGVSGLVLSCCWLLECTA